MGTSLEDLERRVATLEAAREQDTKVLAAIEELGAEIKLLGYTIGVMCASAVRQALKETK